jgi:hypothetical protein
VINALFLQTKGLNELGPMPVIGFSVKIIAKVALKE